MLNLRLTTPIQQFEPDEGFELNPSVLEKSFKEYQHTPMVERVAKLDAAITRFNEIKLENSKRVKLLEVFFNSFQKLLQGCDEMRIAQLNVSSQQKRQIKKEIMWLYIKLSHGYKIVVKDFMTYKPLEKPTKEITLACFRALELTYLSLLYSYRFDIEEPPLCYLEMNQLYMFAESYDIQRSVIRAAQGYAKTPTIESFYVLCMLFSNLDPRQYESYTLEVLVLAMQPMVFNCQVSNKLKFTPNSYFYSVNLNENHAAEILLDDKVTALSKSTRYINVESFVTEMQNWLDKNQNSENALLIEQELELFPAILTRLKINHSQKPGKKSSHVSAEKSDDTASANVSANDDYRLIIGLASLESLLIMDEVGIDLHLKFDETRWSKISDTSTGCELLSCGSDYPENIGLGELVAIVTHNTDAASSENGEESSGPINLRQIGQIVALRQMEDNRLLIELECIKGSAHPLTYRRLTCEDRTFDYTSAIGIYIKDQSNAELPPQMLVANKHFRRGQHYLIITRENSFSIEACELIKRSMQYSYFTYKVLQPSISNPNIPQQKQQSAS